MTPERLQRLRTLLGDALALPEAERPPFVAAATAGDPGLRDELQALLAAAVRDDDLLEPLLLPVAEDPGLAVGQRIGAWRVVSKLGAGGMGEVWLAERADGVYSQRVAIKVPRKVSRGPTTFARFERERSLLAGLEHPGIARLVDGGLTGDGRPWLAMEYVEGRAIDLHCAVHGLDAKSRVQLLVAACRALAAAHRSRIVHRDLKPGNVLVRDDGQVVLVDFGIAAALDSSPTAAVAYLATPRYCAPEQLDGAPATTAVDVFSLAVVGRELLGDDVDDDLRAVFAAATAADPAARTPSADSLAAELQRWLDHWPVAARPATTWHSLRLWGRRAPRTVAAVAALLVSVLASLAASTLSWRAERAARERATAAQVAQAQRYAQVRALVGDLVTGVHDRIATLPGAVPVRAFVIERAEQHLALLSADAAGDAELAHEIIGAHLRLAEVRGARTLGHAADYDGALRSVAAGIGLAEDWRRRRPHEALWSLRLADGRRLQGDLLRASGDTSTARREYSSVHELLAAVQEEDLASQRDRLAAVVLLQLGKLDAAVGASDAALGKLEAAQDRLAALAAASPTDPVLRRDMALARSERGYVLAQLGRYAEASAAWSAALAVVAEDLAARPNDAQLARDRLEFEIERTFADAQAGRPAAEPCERALHDARALCVADVGNVLAERLLHRALLRAARLARCEGRAELSAARYREAELLLHTMHSALPGDHAVRLDLAEARIGGAEAERVRGVVEGVEAAFEAGLSLLDAESALAAGDHLAGNLLTMAWVGLAHLALAAGDLALARERFERWHRPTLAWAERFPDLPWPLRHSCVFEAGFGSACEQTAADSTMSIADRRGLLQTALAAFTRGLHTAERLGAAARLAGPDRAMPTLFAHDVARIEGALRALLAPEEEVRGR